ncbi:hypothetical protein L6452_44567 [Arctium lappa]|uniref:Uncharacterized protein n=1 Tax=Arctium lappa TaxID=4217 RepID=A0ACB8XFG6_ARCLA|nr:hypothetical protein L6452_44567 [Arctium lappa]
MVNTRSRVGVTEEANEISVTAPGANRQVDPTANQVIPPIPPMLEGIVDATPQGNLEAKNPIIQEVDPQSVLLSSIMQMMNSAMDKRDERLMKVLEDRDASNRRHETVGDNEVMGSGTTNPLTCMKWIQDVEMAFESSECADSQRVKFASQLLRGDALSWWNVTRRALTTEVLAKLTWPTFKKKIMEKYCNERALDKIEEFRSLKKGDLSVADYAKQFLDKLSLVEHLATDEGSKIKAFVKGLLAEMKTDVRNAQKATLQEVIEFISAASCSMLQHPYSSRMKSLMDKLGGAFCGKTFLSFESDFWEPSRLIFG